MPEPEVFNIPAVYRNYPGRPWNPIVGTPGTLPPPVAWVPPIVVGLGSDPPPPNPIPGTPYPPVVENGPSPGPPGTPLPPANLTTPVLSGSAVQGSVLNVTNGTWSGNPPTFTYVWLRGATTITGATAAAYTTVAADLAANITCRVTGTNGGGSSSATSNAIGPITASSEELGAETEENDEPPQPSPKKARRR
jgi:hypothetical protein